MAFPALYTHFEIPRSNYTTVPGEHTGAGYISKRETKFNGQENLNW